MSSQMAERLAGFVQDAVRGGTEGLSARLSDTGFAPALCRIIPLAVTLTLLGRETPAVTGDPAALLSAVDQFDADDFDGVTVAIMYNMINRVSNGLAMSPEWSSWRRPTWLLRLSRRPAAWLLRQAMSFERLKSHNESDEWPRQLGPLLESGGLVPWPGGYQQLTKTPHLAEALCHLFAASTDAASVERATLRAIDRAVLLQLRADRLLPLDATATATATATSRDSGRPPTDDRADACQTFAVRLTARPWSITAGEIGKLRTCGMSEAEILDVTFRIAVLNGLGRLDRLFSAHANEGEDPPSD